MEKVRFKFTQVVSAVRIEVVGRTELVNTSTSHEIRIELPLVTVSCLLQGEDAPAMALVLVKLSQV